MLRHRRATVARPSVATCASAGIESLETRRLFAFDLTASADVPAGAWAVDDLFDINVTAKISGSGFQTGFPVFVNVVLSKDKTLGNADDLPFGSGIFVDIADGQTKTQETQVGIQETWAGGDYYVITQVDPFGSYGESNEANNVVVSATPTVRIVTEKLTSPTILGTAGNDVITIHENFSNDIVTINGVSKRFDLLEFDHLFIDGSTGNDKIVVTNDRVNVRLFITGGGGNDLIIGGDANDELSGANGRDKVFGGEGQDYLLGGASNDYLNGEAGNDTMSGAGGNDRVADSLGRDYLLGGAGNDVLISRDVANNFDNGPDTLSGGAGSDKAQLDPTGFADGTASIEELLA